MERAAAACQQIGDQGVQWRAITLDILLNIQHFAGKHDDHAMLANGATEQNFISWLELVLPDYAFCPNYANTGGIDKKAVRFAALHYFGITCDNGHSSFACGLGHRDDDPAQIRHRKALFQDEASREVKGLRTRHRQVVDRPVNRKLADIAAGEEERIL